MTATKLTRHYIGKEDDFQKSAAVLLNGWIYKGQLIVWCHVPNGGSRNSREGMKLKQMGVKRGVVDIHIFTPANGYNGLAIELKVQPNKPTAEQVEWLEKLKRCGWKTSVVYGLDELEEILRGYFG